MKNKEKLFISIAIIILLHFLVLTGLWAIDIGTSGMISESYSGIEFGAQGLLFIKSPNAQYHLGLAITYLSFLILTLWMVYELVKSKGDLK